MSTRSELFLDVDHVWDPEVLVADTDVLIGDACDTLEFVRRSELLRAIDARAAIAFMSEQTYDELGRVSAKGARGRRVDYDALRRLLTDEYLPRISVVRTTSTRDDHWLPSADDIQDPDDVAHLQVARLTGARAIYSHDKDLRKPGFAPATRVGYNQLVAHLAALSTRRETEQGVGMVVGIAAGGSSEAVSWASVRFNVKPATLWVCLVLAGVALTYITLTPPDRRRRITRTVEPLVERMAAAAARSETARVQLSTTVLVPVGDQHRMEVRVAVHLARHPDLSMGDIAEQLALTSSERRDLATLLRNHSSFELSSRYGWSVGRTRGVLIAHPPKWQPRPSA